MDHQYGIAVTNRFALFCDEEEDPFEAISKSKSQKEAEKKTKSKTKKSNAAADDKPVAQGNESAKKKEGGDRNQPKQSDRGRGSGKGREPREIRDNDNERRPPRRQGPRDNKDVKAGDENVPPEFRERPDSSFKRREDRESGGGGGFGGERGRGRGRGRGGRGRGAERGGSGGFGPRADRKREFDRHSGTGGGIKPTEKKEGSGAHNWGSFRDDIEEQGQVNPADDSNDWSNQEKPELNESGDVEPVPEEDAQPQQMTLDEWKALKTQTKKPEFNIRQAGEGEDSAQWKDGVEYQKKIEDEEQDEDYEEGEHSDHHIRNSKQLVTDIRITFNDNPRRGRGRRGGRGMDRGGRGSRGRGFGNKKESAPRFDNEADFPSLLKSAA